jgi:hypothetical protein
MPPKKTIPKPRPAKREKNKTVMFEIKDAQLGLIQVYGANKDAWWNDRAKIDQLIIAFKMGCKVTEIQLACGISKDQYDYFFERHPHLLPILRDGKKFPNLLARRNIFKSLESGDKDLTKWYAERKMADEFKEKKSVELKPDLLDDVFGGGEEE